MNQEAIRIQEREGNGPCELESTFRYPGPKPQTRENGILMLADAVESASTDQLTAGLSIEGPLGAGNPKRYDMVAENRSASNRERERHDEPG